MSPDSIGCEEAERALLGCFLRLPAGRVVQLAQRLQVEDFTDPAARVLLGAAVAVAVQGFDPDPVLVVGELRRRGLEQSLTAHQGAGSYAVDLFMSGVPASVEYYLRILLEHAYRRRVLEAGERLQQLAAGNALEDLHEQVEEESAALRTSWERLRRPNEAAA